MLRYVLLDGGVGILSGRTVQSVRKRLGICAEPNAVVYVNGKSYTPNDGVAWIPASALTQSNTVRIVNGARGYACEGFTYADGCVAPAGIPSDTALAALVREVAALHETCAALEARLTAREKELPPLFS